MKASLMLYLFLFGFTALSSSLSLPSKEFPEKGKNKKKIIFLAGGCSHGPGEHEYRAACLLLGRNLENHFEGQVETVVYSDGWPTEGDAFENVASIVMFLDGSAKHMALPHLDVMDSLMKKGVGLACIHFAVHVPAEPAGEHFKNWIGGYYESLWSVNPFWKPEFLPFSEHPILNGVKPFSIKDEWYYHMRFNENGVIPILSAVPPQSVIHLPGGHQSNEFVRRESGQAQHVAWAVERQEFGRGFGFTGGHYHTNWANDDYRKLVLNAIAWTAHIDIPITGIETPSPSINELESDLDKKPCDLR